MKKNLNITALLGLLILGACQKDIRQQSEQNSPVEPTSAAKARPPANGTIYLIVTVDDAPGNKILSDNGDEYIHGTDRVEAQILSSDGNFYMNTNNNTVKAPLRTMQFLPGLYDNLSGNRNYSLRTAAPLDDNINGGNTVWIQNLDVLGESQLMTMRAWGVDQQGVVDWRLLFRHGPENNIDSPTDYVKVTRTGMNPDIWTIESIGTANARLVDGSYVALGSEFYPAPFKLTLVRK